MLIMKIPHNHQGTNTNAKTYLANQSENLSAFIIDPLKIKRPYNPYAFSGFLKFVLLPNFSL